MNRCADLQEAMPDWSALPASITTEVRKHLATCADCAGVWQIVSGGRRLGDFSSADLDADAERLLARLRGDAIRPVLSVARAAPTSAPRRFASFVAIAASVAFLVWLPSGLPRERSVATSETAPAAQLFPELLQLSEDQLAEVLEVWQSDEDAPLGASSASLEDLTEEQLKLVLRQVEEGI